MPSTRFLGATNTASLTGLPSAVFPPLRTGLANPHLVTTTRLLDVTTRAWTVSRIRLAVAFLDALNKAKGNQMNTLDELRVVLDDTAQDMAQAVPDPVEWSQFIIYLLEELEDKAIDRAGFFAMLREVQDYLSKRIGGGST